MLLSALLGCQRAIEHAADNQEQPFSLSRVARFDCVHHESQPLLHLLQAIQRVI